MVLVEGKVMGVDEVIKELSLDVARVKSCFDPVKLEGDFLGDVGEESRDLFGDFGSTFPPVNLASSEVAGKGADPSAPGGRRAGFSAGFRAGLRLGLSCIAARPGWKA